MGLVRVFITDRSHRSVFWWKNPGEEDSTQVWNVTTS